MTKTDTFQINIDGKRTVTIKADSIADAEGFFRKACDADGVLYKPSATSVALWIVWGRSGTDTLLRYGHVGPKGLAAIEAQEAQENV